MSEAIRKQDATKYVRVKASEMGKEKSRSPMTNVTTLLPEVGQTRTKRNFKKNPTRGDTTYDHINNAQGRAKTIAIGSRPYIG